ncbi:uncharacterized protein IL334_003821 [Kwoniella shivajii]|uniref:Uncharacterized protein n=1 Tax=Kwoniella shivajii TaxID=564305 RepID=A0ABZ1CYM3_9TREE|nr:hypothetical protein IL334_003821 [Kwoniella shivajii]
MSIPTANVSVDTHQPSTASSGGIATSTMNGSTNRSIRRRWHHRSTAPKDDRDESLVYMIAKELGVGTTPNTSSAQSLDSIKQCDTSCIVSEVEMSKEIPVTSDYGIKSTMWDRSRSFTYNGTERYHQLHPRCEAEQCIGWAKADYPSKGDTRKGRMVKIDQQLGWHCNHERNLKSCLPTTQNGRITEAQMRFYPDATNLISRVYLFTSRWVADQTGTNNGQAILLAYADQKETHPPSRRVGVVIVSNPDDDDTSMIEEARMFHEESFSG